MKKGFYIVAPVLLILTLASSGLAQDKPISLKLGHAVAPVHPYHLGAVKFSEEVARRTGGKIKVDVYPRPSSE